MREQSIPRSSLRLVVGGGIGAGKSLVTSLLAARGVVVIEADAVGHQVIAPGGRAYRRVAERWPNAVIEGVIDRSALAAVVFSEPGELAALEAITHPAIAAEIESRAGAAGSASVAVEVPVTAPVVGDEWIRVWVQADPEVRVQRAVARGMDEADVRRRMAHQASDAEWAQWADRVLVNDGTKDELAAAVDRLLVDAGGTGEGA